MKLGRRQFIRMLGVAGISAIGLGGYKYWPDQGFRNACLPDLPISITQHPLMQTLWSGLDMRQVWDTHVHLVGRGDDNDGTWFNPDMDSIGHPLLKLQKSFYMNAACVSDSTDQLDASYVNQMLKLLASMPTGFKTMLFAFDLFHDAAGKPDKMRSMFYIPNQYAEKVAKAHPAVFEWVASIHPYRSDCVEALQLDRKSVV